MVKRNLQIIYFVYKICKNYKIHESIQKVHNFENTKTRSLTSAFGDERLRMFIKEIVYEL